MQEENTFSRGYHSHNCRTLDAAFNKETQSAHVLGALAFHIYILLVSENDYGLVKPDALFSGCYTIIGTPAILTSTC